MTNTDKKNIEEAIIAWDKSIKAGGEYIEEWCKYRTYIENSLKDLLEGRRIKEIDDINQAILLYWEFINTYIGNKSFTINSIKKIINEMDFSRENCKRLEKEGKSPPLKIYKSSLPFLESAIEFLLKGGDIEKITKESFRLAEHLMPKNS